MTELQRLVEGIRHTAGCEVLPPRGQPKLAREGCVIPDDLAEFYALCGGVTLFSHGPYPVRIVGPEEVVHANQAIVGQAPTDDLSDSWYLVARGGSEEAISIDCGRDRLGRCYDSFWDCHAVAGSCRVVALSFTELLRRLVESEGGSWYWLAEGAPAHGDAYDVR